MESSSREEHPTSHKNPSPVTMEAKMIVATGHDHCQQLKDMLSKEDPSTVVLVMASSNQTSTPSKPRSPVMDPGLLAAACSGSWQNVQSFLNERGRHASSDGATGSSAMQPAFGDEEAPLKESFLDGVTIEGDTFLHAMATNSDGENLNEAGLIRTKAVSLLLVQNNVGDTPLHCAARAAKYQMVSFLIDLARGEHDNANTVMELLRKENKRKWTVMHEAVRGGNNDIVKMLMEEDPQLARLPENGTSPLYLAILMENKIIAETLYAKSKKVLSYYGPKGQNALHAAVLRGKDLTEMLLGWNNTLTIQQDENGSTPLHLATSVLGQKDQRTICLILLKANPDALYQVDNDGSFPIHVAASVDATLAIGDFIQNSPRCVGLRDAMGRTFLHVAVDKMKISTVIYISGNRSLSWILNMQDNDGNTALHVAVQARNLTMFCALFQNREVHMNLTNEKGQTPLDIAHRNFPKEDLYYNQNSEVQIHLALQIAGAKWGICRQDCFDENDIVQARQMEMVKDSTQNLCIGSVLVATVTFGATFALPGGYRADDHTNGGTPTLAGRNAFDAFMLANALAFASSAMATISLMFPGSPMVHPRSRVIHIQMAYFLMSASVINLIAAFALGTYVMLAPVAYKTAIAICVLSSLVLLYQNAGTAIKNSVLVPAVCKRKGICHGIVWTFLLATFTFVVNILLKLWPIVVIYCLTTVSHTGGKVERAAQPPTPLA